MEFCPGFLDEHGPDLARVLRVGKARQLGHRVARDVVVDNHFLLFAVDEEVDRVHTCGVDSLGVEEALDSPWDLSKGG